MLVKAGGEPLMLDIEPGWEALAELTGGAFEGYPLTGRLTVYVNGNGRNLGLPYNRAGFLGDFVIGKVSSAGNPLRMLDKDVQAALQWLERNDQRPPLCQVCGRPGGTTLFCKCRDVMIYCPECYVRLDQSPQHYLVCGRCQGMTLAQLVEPLAGKPTADMIAEEEWERAQAHFTDLLSNPQTPVVRAIIAKYAPQVSAYYAYCPFGPDSYSVEMLFADSAVAIECIREYELVPER
jgi:hypothetical protein